GAPGTGRSGTGRGIFGQLWPARKERIVSEDAQNDAVDLKSRSSPSAWAAGFGHYGQGGFLRRLVRNNSLVGAQMLWQQPSGRQFDPAVTEVVDRADNAHFLVVDRLADDRRGRFQSLDIERDILLDRFVERVARPVKYRFDRGADGFDQRR